MRIGVLGNGMVGDAIATKLVALGHELCMGARSAAYEKATAWAARVGERASHGTFADAAAFGELVVNGTSGVASLDALEHAGAGHLDGKILIDVANPLDFSRGMPPSLTICNTDSLGEQIQRAYPAAKVVKTLNTTNAGVMVNPSSVPGEHDLFLCGNDADAKARVTELLHSFGWRTVHDLGDITGARGMEMILPLWLRLMGAFGTPAFNFHLARR